MNIFKKKGCLPGKPAIPGLCSTTTVSSLLLVIPIKFFLCSWITWFLFYPANTTQMQLFLLKSMIIFQLQNKIETCSFFNLPSLVFDTLIISLVPSMKPLLVVLPRLEHRLLREAWPNLSRASHSGLLCLLINFIVLISFLISSSTRNIPGNLCLVVSLYLWGLVRMKSWYAAWLFIRLKHSQ